MWKNDPFLKKFKKHNDNKMNNYKNKTSKMQQVWKLIKTLKKSKVIFGQNIKDHLKKI